MRSKSGYVLGGLLVAAAPIGARGAIIAQYNFGSVSSTGETLATMETPTASAAGVTAGNLSLGSTTGNAEDEGSAVASYYTTPGPNYLSVSNSSASSDTGFYVDFIVTANAGEVFTPTSLTLVGGAGGSSNTRTFALFDSADGLPTAATATSGSPTFTGGDELGSGTFTTVRSTGVAMNSFTESNFTAADQDLSTLDVRIYFDTQLNGQSKNIDLGSIELDGTVSASSVPEPGMIGLCAAGTLGLVRRSRRPAGRG